MKETDLGIAIRSQRNKLNLSQAALAKQVGTTHFTIGNLERGKVRTTSSATLSKLEGVLGIKLPSSATPVSTKPKAKRGRKPGSKNRVVNSVPAINVAANTTTTSYVTNQQLENLKREQMQIARVARMRNAITTIKTVLEMLEKDL